MGIKCHLSAVRPTQKLVVVYTQRKKENVRDMYWWTANDSTGKTSQTGNVFPHMRAGHTCGFPILTLQGHYKFTFQWKTRDTTSLRFLDLRTWSTTQLMQTQEVSQARGQRENKCALRKSSKMCAYITVAKW